MPVEHIGRGGRFDGLELLGRGAEGEVYRAQDRELGIPVAIKVIGTLGAEAIVYLKSEFRAAAGLSHPNLVQLHELFVEGDHAWFSMELVEGCSFLEAMRSAMREAPERGQALVGQLFDGIEALHERGLVHRDIKPANTLVRPDGRVVLLDFGFMRDARALPATPRPSEGLVGTLAYMAPEQLLGAVATSASDVYAAGALLHEALCGDPPNPWIGGPKDASTSRLDESTPEPLRSLVAAMLEVDPRRRPRIGELREVLFGRSAGLRREATELPFVGRTKERELLRLSISSAHPSTAIEVRGPSGVGKTELVRRGIAECAPADALVLRGRCHRGEILSYQAFDAVIDELGLALLERSARSQQGIAALAARAAVLFPSLARFVAPAAAPALPSSDPIEIRRDAVEALRMLLRLAADRRRLVIWIDDAQWAGDDSASLLADLVAGADPLPVHWVLTTRSDDGEASPLARVLADANGAVELESIELGPLSTEESRELVGALTASRGLPEAGLRAIVEAGAGHPFVLTGLAGLDTVADGASGSFSYVLDRVTDDLLDEERRLLEIVAIARRPTELELLLDAAGSGRAGVITIRKLESRRLLRTAPRAKELLVDSYHDQIPDTLLAALGGERLRDGHQRLALAHEKRGSDAAVLSHHFHGAGELSKASLHAEAAGRQASAALAFANAAKHFESARLWQGKGDAARASSLLELEAEALANAGSLSRAGRRYLEASAGRAGSDGLELRRRAVESLLAGGSVAEATRELRVLLEALKLPFPGSEPEAMLRALGALAAYLLRRGRGGAAKPDALELLRVDTCYSVGRRLADIDPSRGSFFLAASLSRAARCGDDARLARSLCTAGGALGAVGGRTVHRIGNRLMDDASAIAERLGTDELAGMLDVAYAEIHMLGGRWLEALERSRRGVRLLEKQPGCVFECNAGRLVVLRALEELGRPAEVHAEGCALFDWAAAHHNDYVEMRAVQHLILASIAADRSSEARRQLRILDRWQQGSFDMQRLYAVRNEALCDLYDGEIEKGRRAMAAMEPKFRRSVLRQVPLIRIDVAWLRGQLALAASGAQPSSERLEDAADAASSLDREARADASLRAKLLRAGAESFRDLASASLLAEAAARDAAALGMQAVAAAASARACEWRGEHAQGAQEAAALLEGLRSSGVGDAGKYVRYLVPGFSAGYPSPSA